MLRQTGEGKKEDLSLLGTLRRTGYPASSDFYRMHLQGHLENIHPQCSFMGCQHGSSSRDTVYLDFFFKPPNSNKGQVLSLPETKNNGPDIDNADCGENKDTNQGGGRVRS